MAIHPDFPSYPHVILNPDVRWFPADEPLRESSYERLMPPWSIRSEKISPRKWVKLLLALAGCLLVNSLWENIERD